MDTREPAAFTREPYRAAIDTTVAAAGHDARGPWVELADTVLYPEGGGQPADRGRIDHQAVIDVQRVAGAIRHYLAADAALPVAASPVHVDLDWPRRFDHMQQHTAQHVLTAVAADRFGWATTAFHLGDEVADVDLDTPTLGRSDLEALEDAVAAELRMAHRIDGAYAQPAELEALAVRTRGLPVGHVGPVRIVTIGTLDACACGGTHVGNTAEVEALVLLATERMRGGLRLSWVAGRRVRRRLAVHEARAADLRRALGAADDGIVPALEARIARLADAQRRIADQSASIAALTAERLVAALPVADASRPSDRPPATVAVHVGEATPAEAAAIASAVTKLRADVIAVVSAGRAPDGRVVVAADPTFDERRVGALAAAVFAAVGGRGGGRAGFFQGTATSPERIASASSWLDAVVADAWTIGP